MQEREYSKARHDTVAVHEHDEQEAKKRHNNKTTISSS